MTVQNSAHLASQNISPKLGLSIFNALAAQVAVVDEQGIIIAINDAWIKFAQENGDVELQYTGVGVSYFSACMYAQGESSNQALSVLENMHSILDGALEYFELEYPCHTETEERWFTMEVTPLQLEGRRLLLVAHHNTTHRKRIARDQAEAELSIKQLQQNDHEMETLEALTQQPVLTVSQELFGTRPLQETLTNLFDEFVKEYENWMELAVDERIYKVEHPISHRLRTIAEQLGTLRARPRDIVEIYITALKHKREKYTAKMFQVYAEEGRIILLELMGYLASYYRNYAFGNIQHTSKNFDNSSEPS